VSDNVVELPRRAAEVRAVTCGCGGQTFILVTDAKDEPDFVYCVECRHKISRVMWSWVPLPETAS